MIKFFALSPVIPAKAGMTEKSCISRQLLQLLAKTSSERNRIFSKNPVSLHDKALVSRSQIFPAI
jgi:hypothetical protein